MEEFKLILEILNKGLDIFKDIGLSKKQKYLYIKEENLKIDCFDFLKQISNVNKDIAPYKVIINYCIDNNKYNINRYLEARCLKKSYSFYEFSIVLTTIKKYEDIKCTGFDLNCEPNIPIRPKLISPDGFSKRLSMQLNKTLNKNDILKINLKYELFESSPCNPKYIIIGSNYKKLLLNEYIISFCFLSNIPQEIHVYDINTKNSKYTFLYKLFPNNKENNKFIDKCDVNQINKYSKRLYIY